MPTLNKQNGKLKSQLATDTNNSAILPTVLNKLTLEQENLIPVISEKWRNIALSTDRIDHQKARIAIQEAYSIMGKSTPEIIFFDSPYAALNTKLKFPIKDHLHRQIEYNLENELESLLWKFLDIPLVSELDNLLCQLLEAKLMNEMYYLIKDELDGRLNHQSQNELNNCIQPELWGVFHASWIDFFISVLNCTPNRKNLQIFQSLIKLCGWIFPYKNTCLVSERPIKLSFDSQNHFHALGSPAIEFADGFCVYAYHGVRLPQKYGALHPNKWQTQWLIEEKNTELLNVLIHGIFYETVTRELELLKTDSWASFQVRLSALNLLIKNEKIQQSIEDWSMSLLPSFG